MEIKTVEALLNIDFEITPAKKEKKSFFKKFKILTEQDIQNEKVDSEFVEKINHLCNLKIDLKPRKLDVVSLSEEQLLMVMDVILDKDELEKLKIINNCNKVKKVLSQVREDIKRDDITTFEIIDYINVLNKYINKSLEIDDIRVLRLFKEIKSLYSELIYILQNVSIIEMNAINKKVVDFKNMMLDNEYENNYLNDSIEELSEKVKKYDDIKENYSFLNENIETFVKENFVVPMDTTEIKRKYTFSYATLKKNAKETFVMYRLNQKAR